MSKDHSYKFKRKEIKSPKKNPIKELMALYKEGDQFDDLEDHENEQVLDVDEAPLKKLIEKERGSRKKRLYLFLVVGLVVLTSAAMAGFFYFSSNRSFENDNLDLDIEGPEVIVVGETFDYKLTYENLGDVELFESRLAIQLPHGYILESAEPALENHHWELGTISQGEKGQILLKGKIIDELTREQKLSAQLHFKPSNFNSQFSKEISLSTLVEEPEISIHSVFPATITLGQKVSIDAQIKNKGDVTFNNARIEFVYPDGFQFLSAKPQAFEDDRKWEIDKLTAQSEDVKLSLEGKFPADLDISSETAKEKEFKLQIYAQGSDEQYFMIYEQPLAIQITDQALLAYLIVNGSTENKYFELGHILTYSIVVKNNGSESYNNLELTLTAESAPLDIIDWGSIQDDTYGKISKTDNGKEIIWTKDQISALSKLDPGNEKMITFTVPTKTYENLKDANLDSLGDTVISNQAEVKFAGDHNADIPAIKSSLVSLTLNSNINLGSKALYFYSDGTPIGEGPYPPKVDEKTVIKVFWDLSNDIHDMEAVEVSAILPNYVKLAGEPNATIGNIVFDSESGKLSWQIKEMPRTIKEAHANFGIEFTPTQKQFGDVLQLVGNTTLAAKDGQTNELIIKTKNIVTTALEQDKYVTGSGKVEQ
jgi:hypothetical protein